MVKTRADEQQSTMSRYPKRSAQKSIKKRKDLSSKSNSSSEEEESKQAVCESKTEIVENKTEIVVKTEESTNDAT